MNYGLVEGNPPQPRDAGRVAVDAARAREALAVRDPQAAEERLARLDGVADGSDSHPQGAGMTRVGCTVLFG